ncbi:hypothetical protein V495_00206 [Pseudogymnoascus sp. VKM F-4514 (FW-929)]|nr:hypothetical protein V495_00206 [Pseudogymnoascus sp. VKM F-4514 (FW-929)]KFY67324.1 hypothetical protein V497_00437 [Pseudogymnoascus sp. VKM F-4516 (FW-969)]
MAHPPVATLSPGIAGFSWSTHRLLRPLQDKALENCIPSQLGIVSIVQLQLLPGLSVLKKATPARRLWLATLQYISTIPGWESTLWGTDTNQDREDICLLIQWDHHTAWTRFQGSIGLSLMLGMLGKNPSNKCLCLRLPLFVTVPRILNLFCFTLERDALEEERVKFIEQWQKFEGEWRQGRMEPCSGWLEKDGARATGVGNTDHKIVANTLMAFAEVQEMVFCVLAFEGAEKGIAAKEANEIATEADDLMGMTVRALRTTVIRKFSLSTTVDLDSEAREIHLSSELNDHPRANSLISLLQHSPHRHYSERTGISFNIDVNQENTLRAAQAGERQFPGPHGGYKQMGDIHQYMSPALPFLEVHGESTVDMIWFNFKPGTLDLNDLTKKSFLDFRLDFRDREGCNDIVWCRGVEEPDDCAVLIHWKSVEARKANSQFIRDSTNEFVRKSGSLTDEPQLFDFNAKSDRLSYDGPLSIIEFPLLEVTTLEIPNSPRAQFLFERFYGAYQSTTHINGRLGSQRIERACDAKTFFSHDQALSSSAALKAGTRDNIDKVYFTGLMGWKSVEAMQEWYTDFARCEIYERLGHKTDALRSVCAEPGNIKSRIMILAVFSAQLVSRYVWTDVSQNRSSKLQLPDGSGHAFNTNPEARAELFMLLLADAGSNS